MSLTLSAGKSFMTSQSTGMYSFWPGSSVRFLLLSSSLILGSLESPFGPHTCAPFTTSGWPTAALRAAASLAISAGLGVDWFRLLAGLLANANIVHASKVRATTALTRWVRIEGLLPTWRSEHWGETLA